MTYILFIQLTFRVLSLLDGFLPWRMLSQFQYYHHLNPKFIALHKMLSSFLRYYIQIHGDALGRGELRNAWCGGEMAPFSTL